tara:strand:- start:1272 stop:1421 length:150 start_codon:yes stop_codon:yes gene_type:complete
MVKVYIDYGLATELIATFIDEEVYLACYVHLESFAAKCGGTIMESMIDE